MKVDTLTAIWLIWQIQSSLCIIYKSTYGALASLHVVFYVVIPNKSTPKFGPEQYKLM